MATKSNTFEGGVAATTITVANSGGGSGDAFTADSGAVTDGVREFTTVQKMHGSFGMRYACRATSEAKWVAWDNGADLTSAYGRFYLRYDNINAGTKIAQLRSASGGAIYAYIALTSAGLIQVRHGTDSGQAGAWNPTLSANTWYRVEWFCDPSGAAANADVRVRVYLGDDTTEISGGDSGTLTPTINGASSVMRYVRYGQADAQTNRPSTTGFVYLDDMTAFNTTWPGPSAQQLLVPSADSVDGAWTNQAGSNVNMYQSIDEGSAAGSTADYIQSEVGPVASVERTKIAPGSTPSSGTKTYTCYIGKNLTGGATINMVIRLYEGGGDVSGAGTLKDTFTFSNVDAAGTQIGTMIGTYSDWTNIYREVEATQV